MFCLISHDCLSCRFVIVGFCRNFLQIAEGVAAALRIRERLVGVDEGKRAMYFCHGFCELGAYEVLPALREMRDFLIQNPNEVVILLIEDYVSPQDLEAAFVESELVNLVYRGTVSPWPTLRELVESGERVIVFLQSGKPDVPWMLPVAGNIQETPYTFHTPEEFTCRPEPGEVADASPEENAS